MAETMPAHTEAEQTSFKSASTTIKDGIHKAPTSIETQAIPEPTNGTTTAPDEAFEVSSVPHENGAVQVTTSDAVNGSTQTTEEEAVPAPVQTTTGEPNGTNGISNADNTKEAEQDNDETPLFSPSLISPEVAALLPEGYSIRPLQRSDYHKGFLDTLRVLTTVGSPTFETFSQHFTVMKSMPSTYHTLVVLDHNATIVGTGAVIVERKFIHNMGLVGHIEDIAVAKNQQGKKLGLRIIQALDYVAEKVGCYKCILDCSEANEGFYVKCGFKRAGLEMAHYYGRD